MQDYVDVDQADLSAELVRRLRHLEHFVPPEQMGEIWIFPPLEEPEGTREFVLFTRMSGDEEREVYSARERRDGPEGSGRGRNGNGDHAAAAATNGNGSRVNGGTPTDGNGVGASRGSGREGLAQAIVEHGRAPAGRLPGLVESLLRRLGDQRAPVHVAIEGSRRRWDDLVTRVN